MPYVGTAVATYSYEYDEHSNTCNDRNLRGNERTIEAEVAGWEASSRDSVERMLRSRISQKASADGLINSTCWSQTDIDFNIYEQ